MSFEYKVDFGEGVTIKIGATSEQMEGKCLFLGKLGDVTEVKKYFSANGVSPQKDSPMNIVSCLKAWDWEWSTVSQWASSPSQSSSDEDDE
tara:strand:- start:1835 stop:2107 length:273 start_codon:yes stop_codon:yes gene_type:complete